MIPLTTAIFACTIIFLVCAVAFLLYENKRSTDELEQSYDDYAELANQLLKMERLNDEILTQIAKEGITIVAREKEMH